MYKLIPISYSRIDTFKTCPKKFHEMNILKSVPFVQSDAMRQGEVIHKLLEDRIAEGKAFPKGYEYLEPIAATIQKAPGQTHTELSLTFDKGLAQCGDKDWDRAWLRVRIDVAKLLGDRAWAGDYKSGKRHFDELQLKICAAAMFQAFPDLETVSTSFIWLQDKFMDDPTVYHRSEAQGIWNEIMSYSHDIQTASATGQWPAQKNKFCAWCPVLKANRCPEALAWGVRPK